MAGPTSANPVVWYKADGETYADGDAVGTATDQSGNSRSATQGTAANKPTFKMSRINSKPVYRFDGVNDALSYVSGATWLTGDYTLCTVFASRANSAYGRFLSTKGASGSQDYAGTDSFALVNESGTNDAVFFRGGAVQTRQTAPGVDTVQMHAVTNSGATLTHRYNNAAASAPSGTGGAAAFRQLALGADDALIENQQVDLAEVLLYASALNATDRQAVEDYLYNKYFVDTTNAPVKGSSLHTAGRGQ